MHVFLLEFVGANPTAHLIVSDSPDGSASVQGRTFWRLVGAGGFAHECYIALGRNQRAFTVCSCRRLVGVYIVALGRVGLTVGRVGLTGL